MRRGLRFVTAVILITVLLTGCTLQPAFLMSGSPKDVPPEPPKDNSGICIGVSIWSTVDPLGSECKKMLDTAASALGVRVRYITHEYTPAKVKASVRQLCEGGCQGIVVCNSTDYEMNEILETCGEHRVFLAQSFREISAQLSPSERKAAEESPFYAACVHEREEENGEILVRFLLEKGRREIGIIGWRTGDAAWLSRWQGFETAVEKWNIEHPDDKAGLSEPKYGGMTAADGENAAEKLLEDNPGLDAVVVAGGGGKPLLGVIDAVRGDKEAVNETVDIVSTDFVGGLRDYLADGTLVGPAGGTYADPLFAFLAVYKAIKGSWTDTDGRYEEIVVPYQYIVSPEEYDAYKECFIDRLPYSEEEIREMASMDPDGIRSMASALSVEDVRARIPAPETGQSTDSAADS